ncbi:hypothetical protein KOR34_21780 [Posidoniimonas corsicana]|uniref:DUF2306 domain-containing protein n=1 Tax=Posidoniimonas corsicana TaxID=1938618 RepID=A0A5C5VGK2_9BACT|nr:DUF2306 domain-containing protein [Posidoniimonas corsicana]TWT37231.1 hypothetical protein KOR34_21780 [Posidoniimonas corsicana]
MRNSLLSQRVILWLSCWLVLQTLLRILLGYGEYLPPNFRSEFLLGRETTFFGAYQWAFYAHLASGPFCLLSGLALMAERAWRSWPRLHRTLGKLHVAAVLLLLAPSGLWMARYTATGPIAGVGFATLAVLTAATAALGWKAAVQRDFDRHREWMQRTFALLTSAVALRLIGGVSEVFGLIGIYPYAAWFSWLLPLVGLEIGRATLRQWSRRRRWSASPAAAAAASAGTGPAPGRR